MKVYIAGDWGPEHNSIAGVHRTYKGAFKEWNRIRKMLLNKARHYLKDEKTSWGKEMYGRMAKNLSCRNPKKIDNYPQETPYIQEYEVKE